MALGSGLGRWLGYKYGNFQRARDENRHYGQSPAAKTVAQNLFGEADFGWKPPYPFPTTQADRWAGVGAFNPYWRQGMIENLFPVPTFTGG